MMLLATSPLNGRGNPAAILAAALPLLFLAVAIQLHVLCDLVCFHGETGLMMADICHTADSGQP